MISIIMTVYNKRMYVEDAIKSILRQTYTNFELIIVNDGSTDDSINVISMISDSRIKLYSIDNSGVSAARNFGLNASKYKYIFIVDGDDVWNENCLEILINNFIYNDAFIASACSFRKFKTNCELKSNYSELNAPVELSQILFFKSLVKVRKNLLCVGSVLIKREFFESSNFRFNVLENLGEDQELWFKLLLHSNIVYTNMPLMNYRRNLTNSLSSKFPSKLIGSYVWLLENYSKFDLKSHYFIKSLIACEYINAARGSLSLGDLKGSLMHIVSSFGVRSYSLIYFILILKYFVLIPYKSFEKCKKNDF